MTITIFSPYSAWCQQARFIKTEGPFLILMFCSCKVYQCIIISNNNMKLNTENERLVAYQNFTHDPDWT
jgi:hypothetical protein